MESLSTYAKRFVSQVAKPDVDFVYGLSPVISIEQKTIANNPRSTVGTMTDIASYLNLLYATIGVPHCPRTGELTPSRTSSQILEAILSLPEGTEIELRAPVFQQYGEELDFVLTEVRKKGCRILIIDGKPVDISAEVELDESKVKDMDAVVDRFVVGRKHEKAIKAGIAATLLVGDGLLQVQIVKGRGQGGGGALLSRAVQQDAPLRVRRHTARVLHVQQPGERLPHLRRPRGSQAHASGTAGARSAAQHRRRVLRARGVQVQPGHLGWPGDVQPVQGARLLARHAVGCNCRRRCGTRFWKGLEHRKIAIWLRRRRRRSSGKRRKASRSASAGSRGASSGITAATGSAAKPVPGWRRGSIR